MKKRVLSWFLTGILAVSMLAGCGNGTQSESSQADGGQAAADSASGENSAAEGSGTVNGIDISETYEATMVLIGNQQPDQEMVLEAVNEILMRDINTKLDLVMLSMGDFTTQLPLMLQGGDKVDLIPVINGFADSFINNKMIVDLSDYVENYGVNAKKAFEVIGEELLYTGCINDFMYGVPVIKAAAGVSTVCVRADWLEEAGFTEEDITCLDDLEPVYEKVQDGLYHYPEGVDITNSGYTFNQGWELPNQFMGGIWEGNDPDLWEQCIEATKAAQQSCAIGFAYDSSSLSTEIATLSNIKDQYVDALNTGAVDPAVELPKFLEELEAAGMQTVIDEKQAQLDAWIASK